ncbi:MAG: hypothetical protein A3A51_00420 [Candidatus Levybacteria bacterium RIFCSPLOWO2_01_FULL_39_10]|nr:MAG: hypothetical protein A3A51_00420 [Candidatus Levybacteria bacterium RIFCSPLOWO2_01_FULL_39_10]
MTEISYTQSQNIQKYISRINQLRQSILLSIIDPKIELILRWNAQIERIFWILSLTDTPLAKEEISRITRSKNTDYSKPQNLTLKIKKSLDYISQNYLSSQKQINLKDVIEVTGYSYENIAVKTKSLDKSLKYFQTSQENPLIQAGLVHFVVIDQARHKKNYDLASLLTYLFLYKEGYDFRGLLVLDEYFRKNFDEYEFNLKDCMARGTQTLWLEFFLKSMIQALAKAQNLIQDAVIADSKSPAFKLNSRQKTILSFLDTPGSSITNRNVQKMFGVSQITASRDLTGLSRLLLILSKGKGRSVYYTKV